MTNAECTTTQAAAEFAQQGATGAPKGAAPAKAASQKKNAPQAKKGAKRAVPKKAAKSTVKAAPKKANKSAKKTSAKPEPKFSAASRANSKKAQILGMLGRNEGATIVEIGKTTGWQPHSIRGFISTISKKLDLPITNVKNEKGQRCYRLEK